VWYQLPRSGPDSVFYRHPRESTWGENCKTHLLLHFKAVNRSSTQNRSFFADMHFPFVYAFLFLATHGASQLFDASNGIPACAADCSEAAFTTIGCTSTGTTTTVQVDPFNTRTNK
jgi:hypothetical protein